MKKIKTAVLLIATGFTTGVVFVSSLLTLNNRTYSVGGEICFVPMVILLIWFGWMLRSEVRKVNMRRWKNAHSQKK